MHQLIEKYGKQTISELLDLVLIEKKPTDLQWSDFLKRNEIISKKSRATIRGRVRATKVERTNVYNEIRRRFETQVLEVPYYEYSVRIKNLRNETLFSVVFRSTELPQLRGELYGEIIDE